MAKEKPKDRYVVGLPYSKEKQQWFKKLFAVLGYKSACAFIVDAIDEKLERGLKKMSANERATIEKMVGGPHA